MNATLDRNRKSPLRWRIFGSAISAFVGWFTMNLVLFVGACFTRINSNADPSHPGEWLVGPTFVAIYSAAFVVGTWLIALVPLYLLVPLHSFLWRWPVCTLCGAFSGALIMLVFLAPHPHESSRTVLIALAAMTGAITCLFGSLTARRFHRVPASTEAEQPPF